MHLQIVMNSEGDARYEFDPSEVSSLASAEARFKELTGEGFRPVALAQDGEPGQLLRKFNPQVKQTLFVPHLQGG
jgi:hypothetical protein